MCLLTEDLLNKLNQAKNIVDLEETLRHCNFSRGKKALSEYISALMKQKALKKSTVIKNAHLDRVYGYQILSGRRLPSRDKIMQICVGNAFTLNETNTLLQIGQASPLYVRDKRDSVIIYCLSHKHSLQHCDEILFEEKLRTLSDGE